MLTFVIFSPLWLLTVVLMSCRFITIALIDCLRPEYICKRLSLVKPGQDISSKWKYLASFFVIDSATDFFYFQHLCRHVLRIFLTFILYFYFNPNIFVCFVCSACSPFIVNASVDHAIGHEVLIKPKSRKHGYKYEWCYTFVLYISPCLCWSHVPGLWPNQHSFMHHKENNSDNDLQTLIYFRRNSVWNAVWFGIGEYVNHNFRILTWHWNQKSIRRMNVAFCFLLWYAWWLLAGIYDTEIFMKLFICQFSTQSLLCMIIEFSQHCLVHPDDPYNVMRNTVTVLKPNMDFVDGKLVQTREFKFFENIHHEHSFDASLTFQPAIDSFLKRFHQYDKDAMVFNCDYFYVFFCVVFSQWERLAKVYVNVNAPNMSNAEKVLIIKNQINPICSYKNIPWAKLPAWPTNMMI